MSLLADAKPFSELNSDLSRRGAVSSDRIAEIVESLVPLWNGDPITLRMLSKWVRKKRVGISPRTGEAALEEFAGERLGSLNRMIERRAPIAIRRAFSNVDADVIRCATLMLSKGMDVYVASGDDIAFVYQKGIGGRSCMTGSGHDLRLYTENKDKIAQVVAVFGSGGTARALLWRGDDGEILMDRVYTDDSVMSQEGAYVALQLWARSRGYSFRGNHGLVYGKRVHRVTVLIQRAWNVPYLDTMRYSNKAREKERVITALTLSNVQTLEFPCPTPFLLPPRLCDTCGSPYYPTLDRVCSNRKCKSRVRRAGYTGCRVCGATAYSLDDEHLIHSYSVSDLYPDLQKLNPDGYLWATELSNTCRYGVCVGNLDPVCGVEVELPRTYVCDHCQTDGLHQCPICTYVVHYNDDAEAMEYMRQHLSGHLRMRGIHNVTFRHSGRDHCGCTLCVTLRKRRDTRTMSATAPRRRARKSEGFVR